MIIVSIPHTGTRFLQKQLGIQDYVHTHTAWDVLLEKVKGKQIISPLRHPHHVWESWSRRTKRDKHNKVKPFPYISFSAAWHIMHTLDMMYEVDFIDLEARVDPRVKDWDAIGNTDKGMSHVPMPDDIKQLFKLPFVEKHYG